MVSIIVIIAFVFPKIYAQQPDPCGTSEFDCYQETGFRLTSNPVICMDLPSDRNLVAKMRAYTEDAVMNWQNLLNAKSTSTSPLWNIQLIPSAPSDICNISIQFAAQPTQDQQGTVSDPAGLAYLRTDHTAQITIFYDEVIQGGDIGSYHFQESLAPDYQIQWAIKHELGHAFGLGHYMMGNDEQQNWLAGYSPTPSIMVPAVPPPFSVTGSTVTYTPDLTRSDILHLESLYSNNGFEEYSHTPTATQDSTTPQPIPVPTISIFSNVVNPQSNTYQNDTDKFSFTPPSGWAQIPSPSDQAVTFAKTPLSPQTPIFIVFYSQGPVMSDQIFAESDEQILSSVITNTLPTDNIIGKSIERFSDGLKIDIVSASQTIQNVPIEKESVFLYLKDGRIYSLIRVSKQNDYDGISADFQTVVNTFYATNSLSNQQPSLPSQIPSWVKNNAYYWSVGNIGDDDFVRGIQYMIQQKIITIPLTSQGTSSQNMIPIWVKKDAKLWAQGDMSNDDFITALQYMISTGIIVLTP